MEVKKFLKRMLILVFFMALIMISPVFSIKTDAMTIVIDPRSWWS